MLDSFIRKWNKINITIIVITAMTTVFFCFTTRI